MSFSFKTQLFAVFYVVLTAIFIFFLVSNQYRSLSEQNLHALETFLIEQKQQELKNYTEIAMASVDTIYASAAVDDPVKQKQVADILSTLIYNGDDGYFFVYHEDGTSVVHPTEPYRVGQNFLDLKGQNGEPTIQILIENAKKGGDYYRYYWNQPSIEEITEKISYSRFFPKWRWMVGTGVYLDSVNRQLQTIQNAIDTQVDNTRLTILMITFSAIFLIFGFGLVVNLTQKKATDQKIHALDQKIVNIQEEEQRHISRELHDGIVQILVSIKYSLEATGLSLKKQAVKIPETLTKAENNLVNAIAEVRRISYHLHPRILDELGLSDALEQLGIEFSERTGIKIDINKPALRKLLPDPINTTLYRVVQESLVNIEKHARATKASITLEIKDEWLSLTIVDNGIGVAADKGDTHFLNRGIGIRNLAERIEYHDGTFNIGADDNGTTVTAKIPKTAFVNHYHAQKAHAKRTIND
ncbi:MAG: cache domain-containing protein [Pseudomonadota bacterium]